MKSQDQAGLRTPNTHHVESPVWVSVNEAIRITSIGRTRLYECLADGTLKSIKVGKKRLVSFRSILELGQ